MLGGVKLIDSTLVIVLLNGEQEIERERAFAGRRFARRPHEAGTTRATGNRRRTQSPGAELTGNDQRGVERRADFIDQVQTKIFARPSSVRGCTYVEDVAGQVRLLVRERPPARL